MLGAWCPQQRFAGMVLRHGGKLLLLRRAPGTIQPGTWGIPGGCIEPGESPRTAAAREVVEEAGPPPPYKVRRRCTGSRDPLYVTYVADVAKRFEPRLNWEHTAARWVTEREARRLPLHPGLRRFLGSACYQRLEA